MIVCPNSIPTMATPSSTFESRELENSRKSIAKVNVVPPNNAKAKLAVVQDDTGTDSEIEEIETFLPITRRKSSRIQTESRNVLGNSNKRKEATESMKKVNKKPIKNQPASKNGIKKLNLSAEIIPEVYGNTQELDPKKDISESVKESPRSSTRSQKRKYEGTVNVVDQSKMEEVQNITENPVASKVINTESTPKQNKKVKKGKAKHVPNPENLPPDMTETIPNTPEGWIKKIIVRKSGKSAGLVDIYIYNPEGQSFRSLPGLANYLYRTKSPLKLSYFSFSRKPYMSSSKTSANADMDSGIVVKVEPLEEVEVIEPSEKVKIEIDDSNTTI